VSPPEPSASTEDFLRQPGLAPIRSLLEDPEVTEIMINGPARVYVERAGRMQLSGTRFRDRDQLMFLIETMIQPTQRVVNVANPYVDFSLADGTRVNVVLPPLSLNGPVVTLRKFTRSLKRIEDLIALGTLDATMAELLVAAIRGRLNIVFAGGTGAGKTTTLNVSSSYIPSSDRIITIEDTAELRLNQDHVVRLETRRPNAEGSGGISIRDMFRNCLRMRPDRIIIGEVRGEEVVDMLQAVASGHEGSLVVLHAGSPAEAVSRIEVMALMSGVGLPISAIRRQIARGLDLVVQQEQLQDGSRRIVDISELFEGEQGEVVIRPMFTFVRGSEKTEQPRWCCLGGAPRFVAKLERFGVTLPPRVSEPTASGAPGHGSRE
jgi:pilus assembly protein CpaF